MPKYNIGTAHLLFGAWLLLVVQSVLPNLVLCAKPDMSVNLEFASLDSRCECGPFFPASGGEIPGCLSVDDSCSDRPFVTDFGKTTASAETTSGWVSAPDVAGIEPATVEFEVTPRFWNDFGPRRVPLFFQPLSESRRC